MSGTAFSALFSLTLIEATLSEKKGGGGIV